MLSALRLTKINLYKHLGTVNFRTPFILAAAAVIEFAKGFSDMSEHYSIAVNGFSIAFLLTSLNQVFIIFLGVFILFSDLPFTDNQQMFLISRSGKRAWIFSQVFYVFIVSLIYFAFIFVCYCIALFPHLGFSADGWGKIIKTMSVTDAGLDFNIMFKPSAAVLADYSPIEAFVFSFGTAIAISIILGLAVLFFDLTIKRKIGVIISGAMVFVYMFVYMGGSNITYYFSPLNWCSVFVADKRGVTFYPDVSWIIRVLCIWLALELAALFIFGSKKIQFVPDTKEDDR